MRMKIDLSMCCVLRGLALAAAGLSLAACNHGEADAVGASPPGAGAAPSAVVASTSYLLVTQARPEAPEKYLAIQRSTYELCAQALRQRGLVPKPFPVVPPVLVTARTTYASDGKRSVVREVTRKLDFVPGQLEGACEMRWSTLANVSVIGNGQEQTAETDEDGKVQVDPPQPSPAEPVRASLLAPYTIPKTLNGVRLKCRDADNCIVDPAVVLVAQRTSPVEAASRADPIAPFNTPIIVEPVSLLVGKPVDAALFSLSQAK